MNVLQIGGQHGAAPAVGQGAAGALFHQVFVILIHAHVGAVHDFDDLAVDVSGQTPVFSIFLERFGSAFQVEQGRLPFCPIRPGPSATSRAIFIISRSFFSPSTSRGGHAQMGRDLTEV
jgi:hypothetical protein